MAAVGIFVLLSIPSLKLIHSTPLINATPLPFMGLAILLRIHVPLQRRASISAVLWLVFSSVLLASGLMDAGPPGTTAKYLYLVGVVLMAILVASRPVLILVGALLVAWGLFLACWQLAIRVPTVRELGQNYLTVAMPIGVALSISFARLLIPPARRKRRILWLSASLLLFAALSTLSGRAALLLSTGVPLLVASAHLVLGRLSAGARIRTLLGSAAVIGVIAFVALRFFDFRQMDRIMRVIEDPEAEPRMGIYANALRLIQERPMLGYGYGSSERLFGNYPHNVFLEIMTHGGAVLMVFFIIILFIYFRSFIFYSKNDDRIAISIFSFSIYLILYWNISFSFESAYIPIVGMFLCLIASDRLAMRGPEREPIHRHRHPNPQPAVRPEQGA